MQSVESDDMANSEANDMRIVVTMSDMRTVVTMSDMRCEADHLSRIAQYE